MQVNTAIDAESVSLRNFNIIMQGPCDYSLIDAKDSIVGARIIGTNSPN